jgi:hypothetical protein
MNKNEKNKNKNKNKHDTDNDHDDMDDENSHPASLTKFIKEWTQKQEQSIAVISRQLIQQQEDVDLKLSIFSNRLPPTTPGMPHIALVY